MDFLPYGRQTIEDDDIAAVADVLRSDFLTTGPQVANFEEAFARETGSCHAVSCNSGTAALHLAVLAANVGPGQAAIVPSVTFLSTANVVRMAGAEVIFADVDPDTGLMTEDALIAAIERGRRLGYHVTAALPVHLNGQLCDMPSLAKIAEHNGITLIEDACHALGIPGIGATHYSAMACFSTHPVKAITTGEGGVVTTEDIGMAQRMRELRSHGMVRDKARWKSRDIGFEGEQQNAWVYEMHEIGWNYRMPDLLCALGVSQIKKLPRFFQRRTEIATLYDNLLKPLAPALRPVPHGQREHAWHLYPVLVDFLALGVTRQHFMSALRSVGIGSQVHYVPVHRQPYYRARYGELALPASDEYYARCLSIPMFPAMTDAEVETVVAAFSKLIGH